MTDKHFDVIVIGVGGMGSATVYELARRGRRVLGLEQFDLVHNHGSSHGTTRVIRKAYYEHPNYVPLLHRAYERWYDLEQAAGMRLLVECGCLNIGSETSELIQGVRAACDEHHLAVESLTAGEIRRRFPPLHFDEPFLALLEHDAGFVLVEDCVQAHIDQARRHGALIHAREEVQCWQDKNGVIEVVTPQNVYRAPRLVLTCGPWAMRWLARLKTPLTVMRQTPHWFATSDDALFRRNRFPIYMADTSTGYYYGFPVISGDGHKIAQHYGAPELARLDQIRREVSEADEVDVRGFLSRHVPLANGPRRRAETCLYTLTPDRHFILDVDPVHRRVAVAAGFSGHGFKFAPVVGEIMADLVESGSTRYPIDMFRLNRFSRAETL